MIVSMNESLSEQAIREELTKLLTSPIFARSERLGRFLQFTVDRVLAGRQNELKEYVIGVEAVSYTHLARPPVTKEYASPAKPSKRLVK